MSDSLSITGRNVIVTGGTRGIGLAIASALLQAGAQVLIVGRKTEALDAALAELDFAAGRVVGIAANVGKAEDRASIISAAISRFGSIDALVNNAAANPVFGKLEDTEPWAFAKIIEVNLEAPFELAKLALPYLSQHSRSDIINISSIGGLRPEPGLGIYSVSKAALNSLSQTMAKEWGPRGVHVNAICPGLIRTEFSRKLWEDEKTAAQLTRHTPLGRIGEPEDIGNLIAALLGPAGAYISGQILTADGGYTV